MPDRQRGSQRELAQVAGDPPLRCAELVGEGVGAQVDARLGLVAPARDQAERLRALEPERRQRRGQRADRHGVAEQKEARQHRQPILRARRSQGAAGEHGLVAQQRVAGDVAPQLAHRVDREPRGPEVFGEVRDGRGIHDLGVDVVIHPVIQAHVPARQDRAHAPRLPGSACDSTLESAGVHTSRALEQSPDMTVTSTAQGAHARLANDLAGRRRPRRWRPLAAAMLALAIVSGTGAGAIAADRSGEQATVDAAAERALTPRVTLAPLASGVVTPETSLVAPVIVENLTEQPLASSSARLEIGHAAISDRAVLDAWLAGTLDRAALGPFVAGGEAPVEPVLPGELATATITVEGAAPELAGLAPGVYPILVHYTPGPLGAGADPENGSTEDGGAGDGSADPTGAGAAEPIVSTSTMIVRDPAAAVQPFEVGLVVPITAPALATGLLSAAELQVLTAPGGALSASLDAAEGTPAILAVDPAILAAIRVLGTGAPSEAVNWLRRLEALPNERFSLAFADGDLATAFASGLPTPLSPSSLQAYMRAEDFTPAPAPSPSAATPESGTVSSSGLPKAEYAKNGMFSGLVADSPPPDTPDTTPSGEPSNAPEPSDEPLYPSIETLLDVPGARPGITWPVTGTASGALLAHLDAAATAQGSTGVALLASANTAQGIETRTVPARGVAGDSSVLVYDASISATLRNAASAQSTLLRGAPLTAVAARIAARMRGVTRRLMGMRRASSIGFTRGRPPRFFGALIP